MKKEDKQVLLGVVAVVLAVAAGIGGGWWWQGRQQTLVVNGSEKNPPTPFTTMKVGDDELKVEIRKTAAELELGLSYREGLGANEGMVFMFGQAGIIPFWMKDMRFPLDVVWIRDKKVIGWQEKVGHPTTEEPRIQTMVPTEPVDMVLEVPAGWVGQHSLKVGDTIAVAGE